MVEVDPRLFVTCRLCLEVEGQFQIIPSVQEQIKYCFDIDVEPFDCLPQLVCRKCQQILSQYYNIKQNFLEKQKELRKKVQGNVKQINNSNSLQQHEPASSSSSVNNKSSRKKKHKSKKVRKRIPTKLGSSSSSDELDTNDLSIHSLQKSDSDNSSSVVSNKSLRKKKHKIKKVNKRILNKLATSSSEELDHIDLLTSVPEVQEINCTNEDPVPWEANLCKYLVCRICSKKFQNKEGIRKHIREHSNLRTKYKNVFNKCCLVVIEKFDGTPNVTKSDKAVMHSSESYIENEHNPYYYIMYHPKNYQFPPNNAAQQSIENNDLTIHDIPRKRKRIMSSETVVINPNEHRNDMTQIIDCIDIDDSSDNESCESNDKSQTSSVDYKNEEGLDSKSVNNIIRMCYNRYAKKFDLSRRNISANNISAPSTLQRKVISIGRKIINKRGINCTGLLRYLEYKDLKVIWKDTCLQSTSTDSKFVRISTRMNGNDSSDPQNEGWKNITELKQDYVDSNRVYILKKMKTLDNFKDVQKSGNQKQLISEETNSTDNLPVISSVFSHKDLEISKTVEPESNPQKLLNTSPALHPKQLPKSKVNNIESSMNITRVFSGANNTGSAQLEKIQVIRTDEEANDISMPIIQSTESLATWPENGVVSSSVSNENHAMPPSNSNPQIQYPRIKVKSFSQLMPEKSTNNTPPTNTIYTIQRGTESTDSQNVPFRNFDNRMNSYSPTTNTIYAIPSGTQFTDNQNVPNNFGNIDNRLKNYQIVHNQIPVFITANNGPAGQPKPHIDSMIVNESSRIINTPKEYVIMHTAELPNEKTDSPFKYLKNLLQIHSITLLDTESPLPPESTCLINLRYLYQQENRDPVTLTWSLFSCKKIFCIKVRDVQHRDISLGKLSPQWQWQFLKIYSNEVVNNILETAKRISNDTYNNTKNFFTLIQSIQCRTI